MSGGHSDSPTATFAQGPHAYLMHSKCCRTWLGRSRGQCCRDRVERSGSPRRRPGLSKPVRCAGWTLTPPRVIGSLLLASLFLLASLLVASLLVAVPLREGRLRSLIPLLATLLLDCLIEADAGLAITLPAGSPEIAHDGFSIPVYDSRTTNSISRVVIAAIRTSHQEQECRQEVWRTHGGGPIGVFTLSNRRHVDKIPMPSRTGSQPRGAWVMTTSQIRMAGPLVNSGFGTFGISDRTSIYVPMPSAEARLPTCTE
jgi:hypothetical protein